MTDIVTVACEKGGVGKTTTAFGLGAAAAAEGRSTVLIDLDSSVTLTTQMRVPRWSASGALLPAVADVLAGTVDIGDAISETQQPDLLVLRGSEDLYAVNLSADVLQERILAILQGTVDLVVIDTQPGKQYLSGPMLCATKIVVPSNLDMVAMPVACRTIRQGLSLGVGEKIAGVLPNKVKRPMTNLAKRMYEALTSCGVGLDTIIYDSTRWPEAMERGNLRDREQMEIAKAALAEVLMRRCDLSTLEVFLDAIEQASRPEVETVETEEAV